MNHTHVTVNNFHGEESPSEWVKRWSHLVKAQGRVLDVACGHGRHAHYFHNNNHPLTLVDRAQTAVESILIDAQDCEKVVADIENGPWPFTGRQFDAVIVTNYLWRPLMPSLLASLAPGGVLIYETFTDGNATVGKPSRPEFLLRPGELLAICKDLRIVAFEDGFIEGPARSPQPGVRSATQRFVQRITAVHEVCVNPTPVRYRLT